MEFFAYGINGKGKYSLSLSSYLSLTIVFCISAITNLVGSSDRAGFPSKSNFSNILPPNM